MNGGAPGQFCMRACARLREPFKSGSTIDAMCLGLICADPQMHHSLPFPALCLCAPQPLPAERLGRLVTGAGCCDASRCGAMRCTLNGAPAPILGPAPTHPVPTGSSWSVEIVRPARLCPIQSPQIQRARLSKNRRHAVLDQHMWVRSCPDELARRQRAGEPAGKPIM